MIKPLLVPGILAAACLLALLGARTYPGGWNDASRLATVESLVDRHTLAIDASTFASRTQDKLQIDGRFYSDKPPMSALLLAAAYQVLQWTTGMVAREQPERFCWWMNLIGGGLPYVVAVWAMSRVAAGLKLAARSQALLIASFAFATVAPAYSRHLNGHIQMLAVAALLQLALLNVCDRRRSVATAGTLAGIAYTLDLAAGPLLLLGSLALIAWRTRSRSAVALALAASAPPIVLHHALAYAIGGTLRPLNTVVAYLQWPGSPFDSATMTGRLHHGPIELASYALALLFDGRGFLLHNLALLLPGLAALVVVPRRHIAERADALLSLAWMIATWLVYAMTSTNHSGACLSIRWFVPLLAPGYLLIGLLIRELPWQRAVLALASAWGTLLAAVMWNAGPWTERRIVAVWPVLIALLVSWRVVARRRRVPL